MGFLTASSPRVLAVLGEPFCCLGARFCRFPPPPPLIRRHELLPKRSKKIIWTTTKTPMKNSDRLRNVRSYNCRQKNWRLKNSFRNNIYLFFNPCLNCSIITPLWPPDMTLNLAMNHKEFLKWFNIWKACYLITFEQSVCSEILKYF